jgi:hypothetical protein
MRFLQLFSLSSCYSFIKIRWISSNSMWIIIRMRVVASNFIDIVMFDDFLHEIRIIELLFWGYVLIQWCHADDLRNFTDGLVPAFTFVLSGKWYQMLQLTLCRITNALLTSRSASRHSRVIWGTFLNNAAYLCQQINNYTFLFISFWALEFSHQYQSLLIFFLLLLELQFLLPSFCCIF